MDEQFPQALMETLRFTWRTTLFTIRGCRAIIRVNGSLFKVRQGGFDELDRAQSEADAFRSTGRNTEAVSESSRRVRIHR